MANMSNRQVQAIIKVLDEVKEFASISIVETTSGGGFSTPLEHFDSFMAGSINRSVYVQVANTPAYSVGSVHEAKQQVAEMWRDHLVSMELEAAMQETQEQIDETEASYRAGVYEAAASLLTLNDAIHTSAYSAAQIRLGELFYTVIKSEYDSCTIYELCIEEGDEHCALVISSEQYASLNGLLAVHPALAAIKDEQRFTAANLS